MPSSLQLHLETRRRMFKSMYPEMPWEAIKHLDALILVVKAINEQNCEHFKDAYDCDMEHDPDCFKCTTLEDIKRKLEEK